MFAGVLEKLEKLLCKWHHSFPHPCNRWPGQARVSHEAGCPHQHSSEASLEPGRCGLSALARPHWRTPPQVCPRLHFVAGDIAVLHRRPEMCSNSRFAAFPRAPSLTAAFTAR
jgi:hypothetical protein